MVKVGPVELVVLGGAFTIALAFHGVFGDWSYIAACVFIAGCAVIDHFWRQSRH